jgi:Ca2+-binding EF-hand superfamily protein
MIDALKDSESLKIMSEAVMRGAADKINEDVHKKGKTGWIEAESLAETLKSKGMIADLDAKKILGVVEREGRVDLLRFNEFVKRSKQYAIENSSAVKKFVNCCTRHGKTVVQRFESQDHNKDGALTVEGFKAALLVSEMQMNVKEITDSFYLLSDLKGNFHYREWILEKFPGCKQYFQNQNFRAESVMTERDAPSLHHDIS